MSEMLPQSRNLQSVLNQNRVRIDLSKNQGLENFYYTSPKKGGEGCSPFFGPEDDRAKRTEELGRALRGESDEKVYVFAEGDEYPRPLSFDEENGYRLGKPLDQVKQPEKPRYFGFKKLMNRIFGGFKDEVERYEHDEAAYREAEEAKAQFMQVREERVNQAEDQSAELYEQAKAETQRELDEMFGPVEQNSRGSLDRMEMIHIDGVTVKSLMYEESRRTMPENEQDRLFSQVRNGDSERYMKEHRDRITEMVTSARLSGRHVRMKIVDPETFEMKKDAEHFMEQPDCVKNAPKHLQKAVQQMGEKVAPEIPDPKEEGLFENVYQRMSYTSGLMEEHHENVKMQMGTFDGYCKDTYFGAWERETGRKAKEVNNPHGMSADRTTLTSLAICSMVQHGYPVEDVLNPAALLEEKEQCGREVIEHMENDDVRWIVETCHTGQQQMAEFAEECLRRTDLSENGTPFTDQNRLAKMAMEVGFDMQQESRHIKEETRQYLTELRGSPEAADREMQETQDRLNSMMFMREMMNGRQASVEVALGHPEMDDQKTISHIISGEVCRQSLEEKRREDPDVPANSHFDVMDYVAVTGQSTGISSNPVYQKMTDFHDRRDVQNFGRSAAFDLVHRHYECRYDQTLHQYSLKDRSAPAAQQSNDAPQKRAEKEIRQPQ